MRVNIENEIVRAILSLLPNNRVFLLILVVILVIAYIPVKRNFSVYNTQISCKNRICKFTDFNVNGKVLNSETLELDNIKKFEVETNIDVELRRKHIFSTYRKQNKFQKSYLINAIEKSSNDKFTVFQRISKEEAKKIADELNKVRRNEQSAFEILIK